MKSKTEPSARLVGGRRATPYLAAFATAPTLFVPIPAQQAHQEFSAHELRVGLPGDELDARRFGYSAAWTQFVAVDDYSDRYRELTAADVAMMRHALVEGAETVDFSEFYVDDEDE